MNKTDCACGCGSELDAFDRKGRPRRFLHGHNQRGQQWNWTEESRQRASLIQRGRDHKGEANGHWKGGRYTDSHGYVWVLCPEHPHAIKGGYIREHRLMLERKLGRLLLPEEVPHHLNGIKHDNRPENLIVCANQSTHLKEHHVATN